VTISSSIARYAWSVSRSLPWAALAV